MKKFLTSLPAKLLLGIIKRDTSFQFNSIFLLLN